MEVLGLRVSRADVRDDGDQRGERIKTSVQGGEPEKKRKRHDSLWDCFDFDLLASDAHADAVGVFFRQQRL